MPQFHQKLSNAYRYRVFSNCFANLIVGNKFQFFNYLQYRTVFFEFGLNPPGVFDLLVGQKTAFNQVFCQLAEGISIRID